MFIAIALATAALGGFGALAAKYGTKWLATWLRESLPVRIDLEREVER